MSERAATDDGASPGRLRVRPRDGLPDFLDLPWERPLADWSSSRLVDVPRGLHRNVVRTVEYEGVRYFVKELPDRLAVREWDVLRWLEEQEVPAVTPVGVVTDRRAAEGEPLAGAILTRQLAFALPYRLLFQRERAADLRDPMIDALADLLVRLHLVGLWWGDCSLSNTLFRRDGGRLQACFVDAETAERHPTLSDGQRHQDVAIAVEKCAGELMDLAAGGLVPATVDPLQLGEDLEQRYRVLWSELTRDETFARDEGWRVRQRIQRINELGYDVDEVELVGQGDRLRLRVAVLEPGRNRRRLLELTGLRVAGEEVARRLLNDIRAFGAWLELDEGRPFSIDAMAHRWTDDVFEVVVAMIPPVLVDRRAAAQVFVEMLDHRQMLSAIQGRDVSNHEAMASYIGNVLRHAPPEAAPEGA